MRDISPVRPVPLKDDGKNPTPQESIVRDTFFANLFREWISKNKFDYDPGLHEGLRELLVSSIEKYTAMQMIVDDFVKSKEHLGIDIEFDVKTFKDLGDRILDIQMTLGLCTTLGLVGYEESIVLRELDKIFGVAKQELAEKNIAQKRKEAEAEWQRETVTSIHNMMRQLVVGVRAATAQNVPKPKSSVFQRRPEQRYSHMNPRAGED